MRTANYVSLADKISRGEHLTDEQIEQATALFAKRCNARNRNTVRWALMTVPAIRSVGIYNRVHFEADGTVSYCAGQSYPDEIRTVRECLIKNWG